MEAVVGFPDCIERAVQVGSVERIITPTGLRPYLIDAVERGMRRTLEIGAAGARQKTGNNENDADDNYSLTLAAGTGYSSRP